MNCLQFPAGNLQGGEIANVNGRQSTCDVRIPIPISDDVVLARVSLIDWRNARLHHSPELDWMSETEASQFVERSDRKASAFC